MDYVNTREKYIKDCVKVYLYPYRYFRRSSTVRYYIFTIIKEEG